MISACRQRFNPLYLQSLLAVVTGRVVVQVVAGLGRVVVIVVVTGMVVVTVVVTGKVVVTVTAGNVVVMIGSIIVAAGNVVVTRIVFVVVGPGTSIVNVTAGKVLTGMQVTTWVVVAAAFSFVVMLVTIEFIGCVTVMRFFVTIGVITTVVLLLYPLSRKIKRINRIKAKVVLIPASILT